jgi:hypothetical protein
MWGRLSSLPRGFGRLESLPHVSIDTFFGLGFNGPVRYSAQQATDGKGRDVAAGKLPAAKCEFALDMSLAVLRRAVARQLMAAGATLLAECYDCRLIETLTV